MAWLTRDRERSGAVSDAIRSGCYRTKTTRIRTNPDQLRRFRKIPADSCIRLCPFSGGLPSVRGRTVECPVPRGLPATEAARSSHVLLWHLRIRTSCSHCV